MAPLLAKESDWANFYWHLKRLAMDERVWKYIDPEGVEVQGPRPTRAAALARATTTAALATPSIGTLASTGEATPAASDGMQGDSAPATLTMQLHLIYDKDAVKLWDLEEAAMKIVKKWMRENVEQTLQQMSDHSDDLRKQIKTLKGHCARSKRMEEEAAKEVARGWVSARLHRPEGAGDHSYPTSQGRRYRRRKLQAACPRESLEERRLN